jgi:hypothetical protein
MQKFFGYVGVEPIGDLAETAAVVGEALGGIAFGEDTQGRYDEFPAYVAENFGVRYALLGAPDPDDDVRDHHEPNFELRMEPVGVDSGPRIDISEKVVATLKKDGRVNCWVLK